MNGKPAGDEVPVHIFFRRFFLGKRGRFRGKRIVFEANGPFLRQTRRTIFLTFPILSPRSYTSSHTPLETGAIYVKSGTVYNHTNHMTRPELIRKKSGKRRSFEEIADPLRKTMAFTHLATVSEPSLGSTVEVDFFKLLNDLFLNLL